MSNEVNQAYLRAYIKSRVANRANQDESVALPQKTVRSATGETETTYRRADLGRANPPVSSHIPDNELPVPPSESSARSAGAPRLGDAEVRGVWSPLGAERGMKGAGVSRTQPAVVVNGTPTTVAHSAPTVLPTAAPSKPIPRSVTSPTHPFPSIRIDSGHGKVVSHLPATPATPLPATTFESDSDSGPRPDSRSGRAAPSAPVPPNPSPTAALPTERKPAPKTLEVPLPVAFRPSWEVDHFFWPEVLLQLEKSNRSAFEQIGHHLRLANQDGLRVMAITSGERGVGRSTVAMHLARCAAAAGLQVGLVDADTCYPSLIDQLRLDMEHGWQDCLFENVPLEEVAVRSVEDKITVYPLTAIIPGQQLHANLGRITRIVKRIASVHDIVLLDSNRLNLEQRDIVGVSQDCAVDAAVIVVDTELSIKEKVDTANSILKGMGIASVGMVENFHA